LTARLAEQCSLPPLAAAVMAARGIGASGDAASFLSPSLADMHDPLLMHGMTSAVDRLLAARHNRETVCVYGDYDVDGITGTALLVSFLRAVGVSCRYFIPSRFDDGYGLNMAALEEIARSGVSLVISVDCGITAVEEALFCRGRNMDLIIADHHAPGEDIPDAVAVLNPLQPACRYPFKSLAGVGVAFNLLVALRSRMRELSLFMPGEEPDLRDWLDLAALGTIADLVPLVGQNRILAFHGLRQLSRTSRPGIRALKQVAGLSGDVSCGQVGFRLAPRLNAAGRMESAVPGVELLLADDAAESSVIALELDAANGERQAVERRIFEEAAAMLDASGRYPACRSIVLGSADWHQGVVGIVASRMVERYHRPTVLLAFDAAGEGKGSGRSIPGFHLLDALGACSSFLQRFGGHRYAAGIALRRENLPPFVAAFEEQAATRLAEDDLVPGLSLDAEARPEDVTPELAYALKRLEPFGAGNPEPVLLMRGLTVLEQRTVGEGHLKLRLARDRYRFDAIAFRQGGREIRGDLDIAFFPEMNQWNGRSTLQFRVKDLRPAE
jgi:single-stranded-DNA-specific exonuclease